RRSLPALDRAFPSGSQRRRNCPRTAFGECLQLWGTTHERRSPFRETVNSLIMQTTLPRDSLMIRPPKSGGGWKAIFYSLRLARRVGLRAFWRAATSKNTCKTCAVGMGGQLGGMVNEGGHFPEVCKKSFQAMASDLQGAMRREFIEGTTIHQLRAMTPRQLEHSGRI